MGKKRKSGDRQFERPEKDPFEKLREWQDNQYNPGYYLGGRFPPDEEIPAQTSLFGKLYQMGARIVSVLSLLVGAFLAYATVVLLSELLKRDLTFERVTLALCILVLCGGMAILSILAGLKYIRKVTAKKSGKS